MNIYDKDHPHNAVFVAQKQSVIDGSQRVVQYADPESKIWDDVDNVLDGTPRTSWREDRLYRLKPLTVTRTLTYPEPLRVAPTVGTKVWAVQAYWETGIVEMLWLNAPSDHLELRRGFLFAIESDAIEAARAIFGGKL